MRNRYDIIIVGAGIAGLVLGLMLAKSGAGYRITILDRRRRIHPVLKPEILQPRWLEILSELGVLPALLQEPVQRCETFNFYQIGGRLLCCANYRVLRHPYPYALIAYPHITRLAWLRDRVFANMGRNEHLMYKTIANEAGLQAEPLTWWEKVQAVAGM